MHSQAVSFSCAALLLDLDGVLVDSTACVENTWRQWAARHALNADDILQMAHGRRAVDTVRRAMPHFSDARVANEVEALVTHEARETAGVEEVPGAAALLEGLPQARWAVVTSGVRAVAVHRLRHVGLPVPSVLVCADDITHGKPHPEGYLTAARRLGWPPAECVVIEDAPAGLAAARAAGMVPVAVATTHPPAALVDAELIAPALSALSVQLERLEGVDRLRVSVSGPVAPVPRGWAALP